jgi:hypothetical protein
MQRITYFLATASLLLLSACSKTDNDVGSIADDGGGGTAQTGGSTSSQGGASGGVGSGGVGSGGNTSQTGGTLSSQGGADGGVQDAPQDLTGEVAQHPYVSNGASCLDYPYVGQRVFPVDPSIWPASTAGQVWPACTLNCTTIMAVAGDGMAPLDQALPAGPCDDEGATCGAPRLMSGWQGPCTNTGGPGNAYACVCRGQNWHCAIVSQGMNMGTDLSCLAPSCTRIGTAVTWSTTQICACNTCLDLCSSDGECQSGHCNLNQVCNVTSSCPGPDECLATCHGTCAPAPSDGGQTIDGGDASSGASLD